MSQVIEASIADLGMPAAAKVPCRAAVGQAGAEQIPVCAAAPDGCVAIAYEHLANRLHAPVTR
jgi:nitrogenase subunit NifH